MKVEMKLKNKKSKKEKFFAHPSSMIDAGATIGNGTSVWQFTVVKQGARIGSQCSIGAYCYVEWGTVIGDAVTVKNGIDIWEGTKIDKGAFIGPGAVFTNDKYPRSPRLPFMKKRYHDKTWCAGVHVKEGATIGAGSILLPGVTVGKYAVVGSGSLVTKSVGNFSLVIGSPARHIGWACVCGRPLISKTLICSACGSRFRMYNNTIKRITP